MKVLDVMTTEVRTVTRDTSLKQVAEILARLGVSGLPVVENGRIVGVVSEADIVAKERGEVPETRSLLGLVLTGGIDAHAKLEARTAGDAMSAPAITIGPRRPISEAASKMIDEQINRLPVVDDEGTLL